MQHITSHMFLVRASDLEKAKQRVNRFLDRTMLIKYSAVKFNDSLSFSAEEDSFWKHLDRGIAENKETAAGFCQELVAHGYEKVEDLQSMPQGFESKVLHTLVHLLDGFIGVDSSFYNLVEDSHSVSQALREEIKENRDTYQLIYLDVGEVRGNILHPSP